MRSVVALTFGVDRVSVVQKTVLTKERRYCKLKRTCSHTGETSECSAPLRLVKHSDHGGDDRWECRVCDLVSGVDQIWLAVRALAKNEWRGREEFHRLQDRAGVNMTNPMGDESRLSLEQRAELEYRRRPRANLEYDKHWWPKPASREALEARGVKIDHTIQERSDVPDVLFDLGSMTYHPESVIGESQRMRDQLERWHERARAAANSIGADHNNEMSWSEWLRAQWRLAGFHMRWVQPVMRALRLHNGPELFNRGTMGFRVLYKENGEFLTQEDLTVVTGHNYGSDGSGGW